MSVHESGKPSKTEEVEQKPDIGEEDDGIDDDADLWVFKHPDGEVPSWNPGWD